MNAYEGWTDADLLAATPGDPDAFATFYRRHVSAVLAYVGRHAAAADVGDLVSEVFATALVHRRRFDPSLGTGIGWLIGIAQHKIADARRRGAVQLKLYRRLGATRVAVAPAVVETEGAEMLDALPDDQRRAVSLRVLSDRSYDQIAADEAVSPATARKRVSRGLAALRARITEGDR
jgi:RNA polymerase sigma-70 factor (ECF subfamily)